MNNLNERDNFSSKLGLIAAAAGSAIGLGNIWRFAFTTGQNGGGAFLLIYLVCTALLGIPVMMTEFAVGRKGQSNVVGTFKKIAPGKPWFLTGIMGVITAFIILSYYSVIAGWVFGYVGKSLTGSLASIAPENMEGYFGAFIASPFQPIFLQFIVMFLTGFIVVAGIKDGIEKYTKILMPILFVLLGFMMVRSLTLDGAAEGVKFLFQPDFSKVDLNVILAALGQAFFSLSLGMGTMMTYGSYISKKENLTSTAIQVTIADTIIALMSGLVIFPAVFALGFDPSGGPGLVFVTLPAVFQNMPLGQIVQPAFFGLLAIAALTSTVSILEVVVAYLSEERKINRKTATIVSCIAIFLGGIPSALSQGAVELNIFGMPLLDFADDILVGRLFLPLGGLLVVLFAARQWTIKGLYKELTNDGTIKVKNPKLLFNVLNILIKYVAPIAILIVLVMGIFNLNFGH
jgi:neurotransmitter:Na+ symporter, NSS family